MPVSSPPAISLRLPATSANLGPGFDALGLALDLWLEIEAEAADEFAIKATGRDARAVGSLERNLLLETYRAVASAAPALRLVIRNGIPLGMGCGSSAAALLAGVVLANHFGALGMTQQAILNEACQREGHPDNVAACFYGGMTASAMNGGHVVAASFGHSLDWPFVLALPGKGLRTSIARALLPETYSRADAVVNVQATALLIAAFALDRPELLAAGTRDALHQPYRAEACPLFVRLAPLAQGDGSIAHAVTLSGAGPSALIWAKRGTSADRVLDAARALKIEEKLILSVEYVQVGIAGGYTAGVSIT